MMGAIDRFEKREREFEELLEKHRELSRILKATELVELLTDQDEEDRGFRLPYSSNPKPIEEPWRF